MSAKASVDKGAGALFRRKTSEYLTSGTKQQIFILHKEKKMTQVLIVGHWILFCFVFTLNENLDSLKENVQIGTVQ